jgi:hypothetical protein
MPVNKAGQMMDRMQRDVTNITNIIKPYKSYDLNLDNLENVEGFNEDGIIDGTYGFKLANNGLYIRQEIPKTNALKLNDLENVDGFVKEGKPDVLYLFKLTSKGIYSREEYNMKNIVEVCKQLYGQAGMPNGNIKNKRISFVWEPDISEGGKWLPVSTKYQYDFDIRLDDTLRIKTGGKDQIIQTIFNSGRIIGSIKPLSKQNILLTRVDEEYFLSTEKKEGSASINFETEFPEDKLLLSNPPVGSTLIINGRKITGNNNFEEIIPGLEIKCETSDTNFLIVVKIDSVNSEGKSIVKVNSSPNSVKTKRSLMQAIEKPITFNTIYISKSFYIKRIRFTTFPISNDEINYC